MRGKVQFSMDLYFLLFSLQENIKRLRETYYYWIGLQKEAEIWQWVDGSLFNNKVIPLENEDPDLNCAFLNDDKLITIDCTSSRHWICVKEFS